MRMVYTFMASNYASLTLQFDERSNLNFLPFFFPLAISDAFSTILGYNESFYPEITIEELRSVLVNDYDSYEMEGVISKC